jgi:uncharacterized damage-inducible protein DinB
MPEAWLRGPIEGVPDRLMPVAHSLVDALEELEVAASDLDTVRLWERPGGVASVGFHLRHVCGSLERLLTYARGASLSTEQLAASKREADPGTPPATAAGLLEDVRVCIGAALDVLRVTPEESLLEPRGVGRAGLPSTVQGLLFHAAEHTRRHAGQVIATARVVRSGAGASETSDAARAAWVEAAVRAWQDAGIRGLCDEGRLEAAMAAVRALDRESPGVPE